MGQLAKQRLLFIYIYIYICGQLSGQSCRQRCCFAGQMAMVAREAWLMKEPIWTVTGPMLTRCKECRHPIVWDECEAFLVGWCYTSPRAEASWWVWELATSSLSRRRVGTLVFSITACRLMIHSILMWILFKMILSSLIIQWFYWWLVCPDICGTCQVHKIYASVILSGQVQFPGLFGLRWILILLGGVLGAIAACPSG